MTSIPFIDADIGDDDSDDEEYNDSSESESESEIGSESEISDSDDSVVNFDDFFSDSDDSDGGDDHESLLIDYLCTANHPYMLEDADAICIENVECSPELEVSIGYTLCGDNIDKNIRRRYQRSDKSTISIHHFHMYAVKNRVDFSSESNEYPTCNLSEKEKALSLMPTINDDLHMKKTIAILISRVLVNHMEFFKFSFSDVVCWHIKHQYYKEMSAKSTVVSAGRID